MTCHENSQNMTSQREHEQDGFAHHKKMVKQITAVKSQLLQDSTQVPNIDMKLNLDIKTKQ